VEDVHLNGNGTLHGGVYASLLDNVMGLAVAALAGLRTATIGLDVHFLGAVREGRITCSAEVVHRTRRIATVEAKVRDGEGNLVALGTGTFRIFEKRGNPIVRRLQATAIGSWRRHHNGAKPPFGGRPPSLLPSVAADAAS
jgi:uncharacterized protein (TIGR00369 family)